MFKILVKLAFIIMAIYVFFQIPFFKDYGDTIKASMFQKAENVMAEVNRIRGKVDSVKEKIDQTEQKVVQITDTVNKTKEGISNTLGVAKNAVDSVESAFTNEEGLTGSTDPQPADPNNPSLQPGDTTK